MKTRKMLAGLAVGFLVIVVTTRAPATIQLNEIFTNPSGGDNGFEFLELRSTTGGVEAMTGMTLLVIEGEPGASLTQFGIVDVALSLNSFSTGTNGLSL